MPINLENQMIKTKKLCRHCGETNVSLFYKSKNKDCKSCLSTVRKELWTNDEQYRNSRLEYKKKNKERIRKTNKKYWSKNRDKILASQKRYYYENGGKERLYEYQKEYHKQRSQQRSQVEERIVSASMKRHPGLTREEALEMLDLIV
jgi:hypothetical protein